MEELYQTLVKIAHSVFHEPGRDGKNELGLAWDVASDPNLLAGWGRYAVLADFARTGAGFDGQLLAGKDADRDRQAATDLRLGADVDWSQQMSGVMGRAVLTAHVRDALYTLDTDVSDVRSEHTDMSPAGAVLWCTEYVCVFVHLWFILVSG